ncbi:nitroreductase [Amycolatopsis lexingtonensis]|uniref:Nitroreductase n=1 Tax=Amycolatopsis lexingtonensis TaxID=218822 RepID=A0ABR9HQW7_9PSEU|nr:nitroreductase family protein [Amycolatopsis lexingtonensis]MBE1493311.1 nitroreductase [Amycolatopsis lexingtonensis]
MSRPLPSVFDQALASAVRAPSPHNTQPWRFAVGHEVVEVWLDRERVLAVADPAGREARLACGAAAFNLQICLRANGLATVVRMLPDPAEPGLVATIRLDGNQKSTAVERRLAEAVFRRHTNRRPLLDKAVPPALRSALEAAAQDEGGQLVYLDAAGHYTPVATLVRQAEALQADDPEFRREAAFWTQRDATSPDGVPKSAAGPPARGHGVVSLRASHENRDLPEREYEQEPLLGLLLTRDQGPHAEVRAGMAMQRVLLTATAEGLATSFLSQPFETPRTREALAGLFAGHGQPHTLLRIGYGYPARLTARRPIEDVLTHHGDVPAG